MHALQRLALSSYLVLGLGACSSLPVTTDIAEAPSHAESILWLNNYFRARGIPVAVAEDRAHYTRLRPDAHGGGRRSARWISRYTRYDNFVVHYIHRTVILHGLSVRFDVADDREGLDVIQRLMVLGVKYNKAGRVRPYGCINGDASLCPSYPDDGKNRQLDPATGPCDEPDCPAPERIHYPVDVMDGRTTQ
ncbi:MAG: hypothetical protein AAFU65_05665 [Pseudomonadota bacterium]